MSAASPDPDEIRRQLEDALAGADPATIRAFIAQLGGLAMAGAPGNGAATPATQPDRLDAPLLLTLTVELDHSEPRIWRRAQVRSDITLVRLHQVMQGLFGWLDYHLYCFAVGGDPFDHGAQRFLCPWEADEGEVTGLPAADVYVDQVLRDSGDRLAYAYDYGDSWELTIRVESAEPCPEDAPVARCTGGRRAAPPEDCGGLRTAEELSAVVDDPAAFDIDTINAELASPLAVLADADLHPRVAAVVPLLSSTDLGPDLIARATELAGEAPTIDAEAARVAVGAYLWFLDALADGVTLTQAGYLPPALVKESCERLPTMRDLPWATTREVDAHALMGWRDNLKAAGLIRKYKGRLLPTRLGASLRRDPVRLFEHLAAAATPETAAGSIADAGALMLLLLATGAEADQAERTVAAALGELGYRWSSGAPVAPYQVPRMFDWWPLLAELEPRASDRAPLAPAAKAFARAALCWPR